MAHKADLLLDFGASLGEISPMIYGHFAEHIGGVYYDGLWVGEDSKVENIRGFRKALVDSFKKICPPVLRWPGGCFAETYDWRDGIGPRENRPERVNWWYSSDHRTESNQVGTHEFLDFCEMVGAEPYFAANMTSVSPLHIRNWVEYVNMPEGLTTLTRERARNGHSAPFNVKYWGIGNENWGGGGQMSPEMCMREYMRYTAVINSLDRGNLNFIT
ncbi:MAG: alpha-L-arabinofuranosidase, partial [Clostridia bacterium]|nr:alpha-L-arabinofuranosidase [Clostridia bacterium]